MEIIQSDERREPMSGSSIATRKALCETMKQLMCEKSFNTISVKSVCESCGINRKSFYYHYRDKFDLVNDIYHLEFYDTAVKAYRNDIMGFIEALCTYLAENKKFYRNAFNVEGQNAFKDSFCDSLAPVIERHLIRHDFRDSDAKVLAKYYAVMRSSAMTYWLGEKNRMSAQSFAQCMKSISAGILDDGIRIRNYAGTSAAAAYAYN